MRALPLTAESAAKFGLIFLLYMAQGIGTGFMIGGVPTVFRAHGVPLEMLWVAGVPPIFYTFKFLWAPLADRHWVHGFGRRRSWLLPSALALGLSFLVLSWFPPDQSLTATVVVLLLAGLSAANMDIATDAYAVELLDPHERGLGNGLQSAGLTCGAVVGNGLVLVLVDRFGWHVALTAMAMLVPLVAAPGLLRREPPPPLEVTERRGARPSLRITFRRPETPAILVLAFATGLSYYLLLPSLGPFLLDSALSLTTIGVSFGTVGTVAGVAGALTGGALINVVGFRSGYRTPLVTGTALALGLAALAANASRNAPLLIAAVAAGQFCLGAVFAVFYANVMNWCARTQAATDFTVISSVFSFTAVVGSVSWGSLAKELGYDGHFLVVAGMFSLTVVALAILHPRITAGAARSLELPEEQLAGLPPARSPEP